MSRIPVKHPFNISLVLYADHFVVEDWVPAFAKFAKDLEERLAIRYRELNASWHDDRPVKKLMCIKRNEKKIEEVIASHPKRLTYYLVDRDVDQSRDIDVMVSLDSAFPPSKRFYHQFRAIFAPPVLRSALGDQSPREFFLWLIRRVQEELIDVRYGLVQPMDSRKLPGLYLVSIGCEYLNVLDVQRLRTWEEYKGEYQHKIWAVWWGNVITDAHLGDSREELLREIERRVGRENLVQWHPGKYFFTLPVDPFEFPTRQERLEALALDLEEVLARYGRLMPRVEMSPNEIRFIERQLAKRLEKDRQQAQSGD